MYSVLIGNSKDFDLSVMENHWRFLCRGVTQSDLGFVLAVTWRRDFRKAKLEVEKSFHVSFINP